MSSLADELFVEELEPERKRPRHENEDDFDRLSDLPDCVLLHLLSFLNTKHAVQTCVLSTRWKHLWKSIPALILHSKNFSNAKIFVKFVSKILSILDGSIALHTFDFDSYKANSEPRFLKRIANCVFSHSVHLQRLGLSLRGDSSLILPCISSCRALTSLKLSIFSKCGRQLFPKSLNLPALTTLHLNFFAFCASDNADCAEPFSSFNSLNNLTISSCCLKDAQILSISSATLVNFTMICSYSNFTKIKLSAPSLSSFTSVGVPYQKLCGSTLSSVKQVNIDGFVIPALRRIGRNPLVPLSWLLDLPNITSLTVTSNILLGLFSVRDLSKDDFPSLCNLKSLKVKMIPFDCFTSRYLENVLFKNKSKKEVSKIKKVFKAGLEPYATISDRIIGFLLQNSPSAKVEIITEHGGYYLSHVGGILSRTQASSRTTETTLHNANISISDVCEPLSVCVNYYPGWNRFFAWNNPKH